MHRATVGDDGQRVGLFFGEDAFLADPVQVVSGVMVGGVAFVKSGSGDD